MASLSSFSLLPLLLLVALLPPSRGWTKRQDAHGKTIIAYYASWQWYDRSHLAKPTNLDHSKVTRYNFAFFQINEQGAIWGTDPWADAIVLYGEYDWNHAPGAPGAKCHWGSPADPPACAGHKPGTGLIDVAHAAGVEVYPSIGGWTLSDPFSKLAEDPAARQVFADNCVKLIEEYDFDGIDIDWEYPGYADHSGRLPEDTTNYSLFLQAIRDALDELGARTGRFYGLTAALPCGPDLIKNIQIDVVKDIMTEFNLMTYDFHGSWNPTTGSNAPVFDMDGSPEFSLDSCVKNWMDGGARPSQINIGLPFYGRSFAGMGLTAFGQTHSGKSDFVTWTEDEGSPQYFNIHTKLSSWTSVRDEQTMTQILYGEVGLVSFDDEQAICDKAAYAVDNAMNGFIIWEISGDVLPDLSTPLLDATNDKINNPSLDCTTYATGTVPVTGGGAVVASDAAGGNAAVTIIEMEQIWYANWDYGFCSNDGRQAAYQVADNQLWVSTESGPSAKTCCKANYEADLNCESLSLNPESWGKWVVASGENPWYANPDYNTCINNGRQGDYHILPDALFSSAEACCDEIYSYSSFCLPKSLNSGADGLYVKGVDEGDPWYPDPRKKRCIADGKQKKHSILNEFLFVSILHHVVNSAEACCDAVYSWEPNCLAMSMSETVVAVQEIKADPTPKPTNKPKTPAPTLNPTPEPTPRPTEGSQLLSLNDIDVVAVQSMDGVVKSYCGTSWNNANSQCGTACPMGTDEECPGSNKCYSDCDACPAMSSGGSGGSVHYYCGTNWAEANKLCSPACPMGSDDECPGTSKCFGDCTACPAMAVPKELVMAQSVQAGFYPDYEDKGTYVHCRNDGSVPDWFSDTLSSSRDDCCASYSHSSLLKQCAAGHPYYPDFKGGSCVNDGMHPSWQGGDYLHDDRERCCNAFSLC
ncbi:hypothetical protein ACHAWF_011963 [Thalassiosira exigua]